LLREGLDMPEVSLVTILDADKEGFLRSERSLIQTIGRAARHIHGRAILYADRVTGSMQRALDETSRRRERQQEYNRIHGITPQGVRKEVIDILEGGGAPGSGGRSSRGGRSSVPAGANVSTAALKPEQLEKQIAALELQMYQLAKNLEFEQAARVRDELKQLKAAAFREGY